MRAIAFLLALLLAPSIALACDPLARATPASECITGVTHPAGGAPGVLLSVRNADMLSKAYAEAPSLRESISELIAANSARQRQAIELQAADQALTAELRDARAWYRSPYLWFSLGVGAALLTGGAAVFVTR